MGVFKKQRSRIWQQQHVSLLFDPVIASVEAALLAALETMPMTMSMVVNCCLYSLFNILCMITEQQPRLGYSATSGGRGNTICMITECSC